MREMNITPGRSADLILREELNELNRALADYRARAPMTRIEFARWWASLSPGLRYSFDKHIAPAVKAIVADDAAPQTIQSFSLQN
jgi:hypothetical protein